MAEVNEFLWAYYESSNVELGTVHVCSGKKGKVTLTWEPAGPELPPPDSESTVLPRKLIDQWKAETDA